MIGDPTGVEYASLALTASALKIVCKRNGSCVNWVISTDELVIKPIPPKQVIILKADEMFQSAAER